MKRVFHGAARQVTCSLQHWAFSLMLVFCFIASAQAGTQNQLLIKWRDGPESYAASLGNSLLGSTVAASFPELGWQQVILPTGMSVADGLRNYRSLDGVLAAEPNLAARITPDPVSSSDPAGPSSTAAMKIASSAVPGVIPNDPRFGTQWNMKKIGATNAWAITTGSSNIVVAILDTGIDYTHPDLVPNLWRNPGETGLDAAGHDKATNGIDDDGNGYVDDVYGIDPGAHDSDPRDEGFLGFYHGTACAGIVGAAGNNALGVAGINWQVKIMAVKILRYPEEEFAPISTYLEAFNYVLMMKKRGVDIRATSNSYGHWPSQAWSDAVRLCTEAGIVTACACGNEGRNGDTEITTFPAQMDTLGAIAVAASTSSDGLASFSTYGHTTADLAAPGENVPSTFVGSGGYITDFSGTSASAPHVAGAVALLCAARPESTVAEIKTALLQSVDQPAAFKGKVASNGRLNLARALAILGQTNLPPAVIHVAPVIVADLEHAPLTMVFSKPMDRASVEAGFSVTNSVQASVPGAFAWSDDNRTLTFTPSVKLAGLTRGFVTVRASAHDTSGLFLDGNFDRAAQGDSTDDFQWTFRTPPSNDNPDGAITLSGDTGQIEGNNATADVLGDVEADTLKGGFPGAASVWYRWTAPRAGAFTFESADTSLDTLLAIYQWIDFVNAVPVEMGSNDNFGGGKTSHVTFLADAGTEYYVVLDTKRFTNSGPFALRWSPTPPPAFAVSAFIPVTGPPGSRLVLRGTNFIQTTAVLFGNVSAPFSPNKQSPDQQLFVTVPPDADSGPITVVTPHGSTTTTGAFQLLPPPLAWTRTAAGALEIQWPATSRSLVLEESSDLSSGVWTAVSEPVTIGDAASLATVSHTAAERFFRLRGK